jgi:hypothetical protein
VISLGSSSGRARRLPFFPSPLKGDGYDVADYGFTALPTIETAPCFLTLGPYGFYWFEFQRSGN